MSSSKQSKVSDATKIRDEKIVSGFVRTEYLSVKMSIPKDILELLYLFYHVIIIETFKHYKKERYKVEKYDTKLSIVPPMYGGDYDAVAYGSQCISSMKKRIHSWSFKIIKKTNMEYIAIGIDETTYKRKNGGFDTKYKSKSYALWSNGYKCKHGGDLKLIPQAPRFDTDDIVNMTLDLASKILSYQVNDGNLYVAFKNIKVGKSIKYCMGVCISCKLDCIELLSYTVSK